MRYCAQCGTAMADEFEICMNCGYIFPAKTTAIASRPPVAPVQQNGCMAPAGQLNASPAPTVK